MASNDDIQTDRIDLTAAISINDHSEVMIDSELDSSLDTCSDTDWDFLKWMCGLLHDYPDTGSSKFQKRYLSITEDEGVTPLHKACARGDLEQVTLLCDTSNIETPDLFNNRPIHVASIFCHVTVVAYLYEHQCDIDATGMDNIRPIHYACRHGHLDIVRFLCEQNCDIEAEGWFDHRPIHYACRYGHLDIVRFLFEQNCDIEAPGWFDNRPIHYACEHGRLDIVTFLCEKNCDIEISDDNNKTPIHYACRHGHLDILSFLCEKNCDIEASDKNNKTPIHYACEHGHIDIVRFLYEHKCQIEVSDMNNYRPIHYACEHGHLDVVRVLCEQNCNLQATTLENYKPIQLAQKYRRNDIVKYLSTLKNRIKDSDTMDISVLPSESKKRRLIEKIPNMKIKCDVTCDHSSCLQSIYSNKILIGRGGFGAVYNINYPKLAYTLCMKLIHLDPRASNQKPKHIEFNIKEYLHILHHERIVQYFGMVNTGEDMLIFMEYVDGISLNEHINKKPLPHNKVIQYSKEILEGVKFLHQNKIIHRDIKPQNIMLNKEEHVKLCDFGLSCYLESIGQKSQIHTADSSNEKTFCGTVNYIAPEIVDGQKYSYPVDIWGLGASVVEMLTGTPPFHGMPYVAIIFHIGTKKKIDFTPAEPMSKDMKSFVDQMLCPCMADRATAEKLLEFIDKVLEID